jgi:PhzF family phenazine biosynthesis protein
MSSVLYRYAAFTTAPQGGNPAGVWIGDALPDEGEMQRIAAEIGLPDTAFIAPAQGLDRSIRYYSPETEVGFCGHATIATGVILGKAAGAGTYRFTTGVGVVPVAVYEREGRWEASLTSVVPKHEAVPASWSPGRSPHLAGAKTNSTRRYRPRVRGNWHLLLAADANATLRRSATDFARPQGADAQAGLATLQLIWRERDDLVHARNPFPVGGVVEDPASGSAAAALAGYLRDARLIAVPARMIVRQGETMGRPSRLVVDIPVSGGIVISGNAVPLEM